MQKLEQLYEGKAKKVFKTDDPDLVIVAYKDDATANNGLKKGTIGGKGIINNRLTNFFMQMMEQHGIPTHFVQEISERETIVKKVTITKLEVIVRNVAAGSFTARLGVAEGTRFASPTLEYSYKDDALGDPLINSYHAIALGAATRQELDTIDAYAFKVNEVLKAYLAKFNIDLIDFKLEFGRLPDGTIVLADEISPDTCRFWDATTGAHLDKDLFRRDLGGEEDAYREVLKRLLGE